MHQDTGRGVDRGQEPLELHEGRAPGAHRQRPRGHGVHPVPGRRPAELHGSGPVHRVSDKAGHGSVDDLRPVRRSHDVGAAHHANEPHAVRLNVRQRPHAGRAVREARRPVRSDHHRAACLGLRFVRRVHVARAHDLRRPVTNDHARGARVPRPRAQPGHGVAHACQSRCTQDVRPAVRQRCPAGVQHVRGQVHRVDAEAGRTETLRLRPARPTVCGIRQHTFHHRSTEAHAAERGASRWRASGTA